MKNFSLLKDEYQKRFPEGHFFDRDTMRFFKSKIVCIVTVDRKPTADMPLGVYKVIKDGLYWGHYRIHTTWTGVRCVSFCNDEGQVY